jgi:dipeptidyl aminopeptidase/acylaminoacyl peptidase
VLTEEQHARDRALQPRAAAIVDAYANTNGPFTSLVAEVTQDGKRVLFGSMRNGLQQIYLGDVAKPGEPPRALTTGPERAMWAAFTRDDKHVLFTRDEGADENWRIYREGLDGSAPTCLTPGPKLHRDEPLLPRAKPDTMVYTTHESHSPASQLVVQGISAGEPRVVYEDPAPANGTDVTADGRRALLLRFNSASDFVVLEVDTAGPASGKAATRIYPPEGTKATVSQAAYSPDGRVVYVATDEGKEGGALVAVDAKTRAVRARYALGDPPTAIVANAFVSPAGDRIAVLVDAGNHDEIRILDARTLALQRKLPTPLGLAGVGSFTPDGKRFAYWLSTPDRPADPFLADAATGESRPLRRDDRAGLEGLSPLDVSIETTKAFDGLTIPINLYLPRGDRSAKHPVLLWFHGGPSGSYAVRWHAFLRFFTSLGYAIAEPNVRGSTGFGRSYEMADNREKRGDVLHDMETVNAWAKAQPWCDPRRVIVFGGSYGGYVTLMALTRQPALWRAGVDLYGIANLRTFMRSTDPAIRSILTDEFGDPEKDAALLDEYSPSRDYAKIVAPLFVYAGQNDPRVPRSESDQIVLALRQRSVPVEYMVAPNEGHSVDRRDTRIEFLTRVARFLEDNTK